MFADLYDHRWAAIVYGLVTTGVGAVCLGFVASISSVLAIGGVLLVVTGICVLVNLSVPALRLLWVARSGDVTAEGTSTTP